MENIKEILKERILILDGAMGTMIQQHDLQEKDYRGEKFANFHLDVKGNNDLLSITQPKIILDIHKEFLEAGSDIIETNTFNANKVSMADYEMEEYVQEINIQSVKLARQAADEYTKKNPDKPRFVAGAIGPTNRTASMSPDVNRPGFREVDFDYLHTIYKEQARSLMDAGVDLLLVETVFDTLNCKAALFAINELKEEIGSNIPIMVSFTITDSSGRTLSGQTTDAFWNSVNHADLLSIGLNCALGPDQMRPYIEELNRIAWVNTSLYPNAGLPNEFGEYDETPEKIATHMYKYADEGLVNIVGGCCGTTPAHIKAIAECATRYKPRKIPELSLINTNSPRF